MKLLALVLALTSTASTLPRVSILLYPQVLLAGQAARLECRVARHPDNRWLQYGVAELGVSLRQLDGEAAPVIYHRLLTHVPCGQFEAFCLLTDSKRQERYVSRSLVVSGCE